MKKYLTIDNILLLLTLIIGSFLRFYHYGSLPFSFDEFSALSRTYFKTFEELIRQGVVLTDTHPAGIQVFLFYWVKLVGYSEQLVKLPFILAGIASIYLVYKIAASWFNPTVALISAMTLAFLQYPITFSLFARPYASGLFFGLLMIWFWYRSFIKSGSVKWKDVGMYVLASALCAYNHHFTLFLVGLLWLSGLPLVRKKRIKVYFLAGVAVFLLYVPHLKIFFTQLGKGGVEDWLAKPTSGFFMDYIQYIFHYNMVFIAVAGLLIIVSLIWKSPAWKKEMKFRWLLFSVIAVTWATAYFYSVYLSAILQFSVLIFTFPLLMILMFSFIKDISSNFKIILFLGFGTLSIYTLVEDRQHFRLTYESGYREVLVRTNSVMADKGSKNVTAFLDQPAHIQKYYLEKLQYDSLQFCSINDFSSFPEFEDYVSIQTTEYFVLGWNNPQQLEYLSIARKYFPVVLEHQSYFLSDFYLLGRDDKKDLAVQDVLFTVNEDYKIAEQGLLINSWDEYHKLFEGNLDSLIKLPNNQISVELDLTLDFLCGDNMLVCDLRRGDELLQWETSLFKDFIHQDDKDFTVYKTLKMLDKNLKFEEISLRIYIWNKSRQPFYLKNFKLEVMPGNPVLYGLYEEIL